MHVLHTEYNYDREDIAYALVGFGVNELLVYFGAVIGCRILDKRI